MMVANSSDFLSNKIRICIAEVEHTGESNANLELKDEQLMTLVHFEFIGKERKNVCFIKQEWKIFY